MKAIFKREFKSYFQTVIGWLFLAAILFIYFLYYFAYNLNNGYPYISYTLDSITFIMLLAVPLLTMKVLAEEKHLKTDQLLLTSSVTVGKIVFAKYLAMVAVFSIDIGVIALTPLLLRIFGDVSLAESYVAILGFFFYGIACIAIGTFASALTESQVISAILSFVFLFLGYMMSGICSSLSREGNALTRILGSYDLTTRLFDFSNGLLSFKGMLYYLTLSALFLFLTTQIVQKRRWTITKSSAKRGVFSGAFIIIAIAAVVVFNIAIDEIDDDYMTVDVTENRMFTLLDDTKSFIKGVDKDVTIYVLCAKDDYDTLVISTLEDMTLANEKVKVEYIDPAVSPNFYQQYVINAPEMGSLIVVCGEQSRVVSYDDVYVKEIDYTTYSYNTTGYDGEGVIVSAINYVTNANLPKAYVLTGHGESEFSGNFVDSIVKMNLSLSAINLLDYAQIPDDGEFVLINAPQSDLSGDDLAKLKAYVAGGGKLFATFTYTENELTNFNALLNEYQITLKNGIISEADQSHFYQYQFYLVPIICDSEVTGVVEGEKLLAPYCAGLIHPGQTGDGIKFQDIMMSSSDSYLKTDIANQMSEQKEEGDIDGPFSIGVIARNENTGGEMIVYTCATMFTEMADEYVSGHNLALFKSSISSLISDGDVEIVSIEPKDYSVSYIVCPQQIIYLVFALGVVTTPILLIVIGILYWFKRRKI